MSVDRTDIANLALNHVGEPPITNVDDKDNPTARTLKVVFDPALREILRSHEWNFASDQESLVQLLPAPLFDYTFHYPLPTDYIRLVLLNGVHVRKCRRGFKIHKRNLLTDSETADIEYIQFVKDTTLYDALFVEAFSVLIASKIATKIRQDEQLRLALIQQYKTISLPEARKVDGNEKKVEPIDLRCDSRSLASRRTGTFNGSKTNTF